MHVGPCLSWASACCHTEEAARGKRGQTVEAHTVPTGGSQPKHTRFQLNVSQRRRRVAGRDRCRNPIRIALSSEDELQAALAVLAILLAPFSRKPIRIALSLQRDHQIRHALIYVSSEAEKEKPRKCAKGCVVPLSWCISPAEPRGCLSVGELKWALGRLRR